MIENKLNIKIRKGKKSDIPQLIKLYSGARELADFAGQKYDRGYFLQFMKSKENTVLVAEKNKKICGALNAEFEDLAKYTFLNNIIVSKKLRGQGIGGILLNALEKISKKRKNKRILALVYDWNKKMHEAMKRYKYSAGGKTIIYSKAL